MSDKAIAHVRRSEDGSWAEPQWLVDHLRGTAELAGVFAGEFKNDDWGRLAGLWHDLGKFLPSWQTYLKIASSYDSEAHIEGPSNRPNHSTVGAIQSLKVFNRTPVGRILAYLAAGHHAGLPDWNNSAGSIVNRTIIDPLADLADQQLNETEYFTVTQQQEAQEFLRVSLPRSAPCGNPAIMQTPEHLQLWIRLLYSCLVDADFLDTEQYMTREVNDLRGKYPGLAELKTRFDTHMANLAATATVTPINQKRQEILKDCRDAARDQPGLFDLTVPTGGGKTLASMAFALEHALAHGKKRIIMAIPYTSIIEQTAQVYTEVFGEGVVLEHHSNLDPDRETSQSRLAAENWDAPIVVTTNVQLFESLLASRSSANRKLHNIVNSIIILDEAQMLPSEYFRPVLSTLQGLISYFGVTIVLCTATQPSLEGSIGSGSLPGQTIQGLAGVRHIIKQPDVLAEAFKRVIIEKPSADCVTTWQSLACQLQSHEQVLAIVNSRADARALHGLMPTGTIHLSANMCGEERSEIIARIKDLLKTGQPVRVVSTQLVEAGVDIDFPVVYRAMAGLDSVAQAAGRCNREGRLNAEGKYGRVVVFNPPKPAPAGLLRKGADAAQSVLHRHETIDLQQTLYAEYFREYYAKLNGFDAPDFEHLVASQAREFKFQFRTFAEQIRIIDDTSQVAVIILYEGKLNSSYRLVDELRRIGPNRLITRKLQRFVVNIPRTLFASLQTAGCFEEIHGNQVQSGPGLYRPGLGFISDSQQFDAAMCIV